MHKKYVSALVAIPVLALGFAFVAPALADMTPGTPPQGGWGQGAGGGMMHRMPGVFGTVTAINATSITITSTGFGQNATTTTYTVDASNATVTKNNVASSVSAIAVGDMIAVQGTVSGTSVTATSIRDGMLMQRPAVFGTVASISGDTLTVTSKGFGQNATTTTYTVDATNATVTKSGSASSVSAIAVGDTVAIQGTVSGTSVTATSIRDGVMTGGGQGKGAPQNPIITGNGEPVVAGSVTAISGTTITITNKSNVTYTVDASNATIESGNTASTISSIAVGDNVVIQGTVNGNSITASSVIDQGSSTASASPGAPAPHRGFFGMIGGFFSHLFGF